MAENELEPLQDPDMLDGSGLTLWRELTAEFSPEPHERATLLELCRTVSLCEVLQRRLDTDGTVVDGQRGPKMHPAIAEIRQQRIVVARLTASLGIRSEDDEPKPRGAVRGVYAGSGYTRQAQRS
ncbi:terminase [Mycobacterium sp. URHB0021]